jgi:toxin-antitoxin system PIN domain toxin
MVLCDVNVLPYAFAPSTIHHQICRRALEKLLKAEDVFGLSELALAAVVRISTNQKIFRPPASSETVFAFAEALREHAKTVILNPSQRHWSIFQDLVLSTKTQGSDTADAYFAALAIEHACEWWTTDSDFGRFPGLHWRNLLQPA